MAAYIKFDGVTGTSIIADHVDWIVMNSWSWGAERDVSAGNQIGLASGVARFDRLAFSAPIGSATATMFGKMVGGQHFTSVMISCTKNTGGDKPEKWMDVKLSHVMVTKITQTVDEDENTDEIELAFTKVEMWIKDQLATGKLNEKGIDFVYDLTKATQGAG